MLILLLVLAGVGVAAGAYYYGKQQAGTKSQMMTEAPAELTPQSNPPPGSASPTPGVLNSDPTPGVSSVVVYESEGVIPAADKAQLKARNVDPVIDYYAEQSEQGPIATVTVSFNTEASKNTYPYTVRVVFENAVHMGFAVERKAGGLGWWFPECMTQCQVSQQFKSKYPEIAKILGY